MRLNRQLQRDWETQIERRIFWDPDSKGRDRSFRAFIHTASYGRADVDGRVLARVSVDKVDVPPGELESQMGASLRQEGFDAAAIVMLGGPGAGSAEPAGFWARFVLAEGVGVWAMELLHTITGYTDLYVHPDHPGKFDNMAGATGTHPTAFTKLSFGWLEPVAIAAHAVRAAAYAVHTLGIVQPPPFGRCAAVQIGSADPFLMLESREMVDAFDAGIPSQGIIVYEVVSSDLDPNPKITSPNLALRTPTALQPGQAFRASSGVAVSVIGAIPGGYLVKVDDPSFFPEVGQLLFYRDTTRDGTGDVANPSVIGLGGWQFMSTLFSGGDGTIYAIDPDGRLLFGRDVPRDGTGDVSASFVIGQGGWQFLTHVFPGDNGIIYAVDGDGRLLFYRDQHRDGTGDIANPSVIGLGGWQVFSHLFSGGDGIIYAVDPDGRLLFYRDQTQDGTGDVANPTVIGLGGWQVFSHLFSGGDGIIYAVDLDGRLLFYRDQTRDGTGDVANPSVIGLGGWQVFKHLFSGGDGIIYAVMG